MRKQTDSKKLTNNNYIDLTASRAVSYNFSKKSCFQIGNLQKSKPWSSGGRSSLNSTPSSLSAYQRKSKIQENTKASKGGRQSQNRQKMSKQQLKIQYRKYLTDANNVFYEDRQQVRILNLIAACKPIVMTIFIFLMAGAIVLSYVQGRRERCPVNADCGVFIHCHYGYELIDDRCHISKQSINQAQYICMASLNNLKLQFGNKQCHQSEANLYVAPSKQIYEIIKQFEVSSRATQTQIYVWFQNQANQKQYKFKYNQNGIQPLQKKYSLWCQFKLVYSSDSFTIFLVSFVLVIAAFILVIKNNQKNRCAQNIYSYLSGQISKLDNNKNDRNGKRAAKQIMINCKQISSKLGIHISEQMWYRVDNIRVKRGQFTYYEDEHLHWRKFE